MNAKALRAAEARHPETEDERELASAIWAKVQKDARARKTEPRREVHEADLDNVLLVESFRIWEGRGCPGRKARETRNVRKDNVNECAWMPQKFVCDALDHVREHRCRGFLE